MCVYLSVFHTKGGGWDLPSPCKFDVVIANPPELISVHLSTFHKKITWYVCVCVCVWGGGMPPEHPLKDPPYQQENWLRYTYVCICMCMYVFRCVCIDCQLQRRAAWMWTLTLTSPAHPGPTIPPHPPPPTYSIPPPTPRSPFSPSRLP